MADYALISNSIVVSVIVADADFIAANFSGAIDIDTVSPRPGIGWTYDGTTWTAPAAPAPPPAPTPSAIYTPKQFMDLFTLSELVAVVNYQTSITATPTQKQQIAVFMKYFDASVATATVDLTDGPTIAGVSGLEAAGLINTGRAAQILASRH